MATSTQETKGVEINKKIKYNNIVDLAKYAVQMHNQKKYCFALINKASSTQEIKGGEINKNIDSLGKYAVQVHNQEQNDHLTFDVVVKATMTEQQLDFLGGSYLVYCITLIASNIEVKQFYDAEVRVHSSTGEFTLRNFQHMVDLKDVETKSDINLVHIAKFAVKEYNREKNAHLVFVKVMDGRTDPVHESKLYYITFEANHYDVVQSYEAMVWVKASSNIWPWLKLVDFKQLPSTPADK